MHICCWNWARGNKKKYNFKKKIIKMKIYMFLLAAKIFIKECYFKVVLQIIAVWIYMLRERIEITRFCETKMYLWCIVYWILFIKNQVNFYYNNSCAFYGTLTQSNHGIAFSIKLTNGNCCRMCWLTHFQLIAIELLIDSDWLDANLF